MSPSALLMRAWATHGGNGVNRTVFDHAVLCRRLEDIDACRKSLVRAYGRTRFDQWRDHDKRTWRYLGILRDETRAAANNTLSALIHRGVDAEAPPGDPLPEIRKNIHRDRA